MLIQFNYSIFSTAFKGYLCHFDKFSDYAKKAGFPLIGDGKVQENGFMPRNVPQTATKNKFQTEYYT